MKTYTIDDIVGDVKLLHLKTLLKKLYDINHEKGLIQ